jgi:hypothetical protein
LSVGRWPNLFVVGVPKAGTSTLHAHLHSHPEIYMAPVKEPHYFARHHTLPGLEPFVSRVDDEDDYLRPFEGAPEAVIGESSTSYFADQDAPHRIADAVPDAKVVVVLRDPVQRAYSHYRNHAREGVEGRSFQTAVEEELREWPGAAGSRPSGYIDHGYYADRVLLHCRLFGPNFKAIFFEELFGDLDRELGDLYEFLAVDPDHATRVRRQLRVNANAMPVGRGMTALLGSPTARRLARNVLPRRVRARVRDAVMREEPSPAIAPELSSLLSSVYEDDRRSLERVLDRSVPW